MYQNQTEIIIVNCCILCCWCWVGDNGGCYCDLNVRSRSRCWLCISLLKDKNVCVCISLLGDKNPPSLSPLTLDSVYKLNSSCSCVKIFFNNTRFTQLLPTFRQQRIVVSHSNLFHTKKYMSSSFSLSKKLPMASTCSPKFI